MYVNHHPIIKPNVEWWIVPSLWTWLCYGYFCNEKYGLRNLGRYAMSLEIIPWGIAYLLISETIFILNIKKNGTEDWVYLKVMSFMIGILIIMVHYFIGSVGFECTGYEMFCGINYMMYLYELYIIIGITMLFGINKLIVMVMKK